MSHLVSLGYIARAFGIKGGLVVKLFNGLSQSLAVGNVITTRLRDQEKRFLVDSMQDNGRIFLQQIVDRDGAESLIGAEIFMDRVDLPQPAEDEFYLADMQGARVEDIKGGLVGFVVGFSSNNAQDLFEVEMTSGVVVSVPSVKPIVTKIDCGEKLVVIDPPDGLLDLLV